MYFEKILCENRREALYSTRRQNAPSYEVHWQRSVSDWKIYEMALWKGESCDKMIFFSLAESDDEN